jgi:hypothetical protein
LRWSASEHEDVADWTKVSAASQGQGQWDDERALVFQRIVESRAYRLFCEYHRAANLAEAMKEEHLPGTPLIG